MTNTQSAPRILVFDSGVGGLSIADTIMQQHPNAAITYASDNAAFPYGTQSEATLIDRIDQVLQPLQEIAQADIIVIACNTASTIALPRLREYFELPIVGVVPAIKPAAKLSASKTIGLLATPGTINRHYTQQLMADFAKNCTIIPVGSNTLVEYAENKLRGYPINTEQLQPILSAFVDHPHLDTIVLACTHFPLLKHELQSALPKIQHWVDSGEAIARRVGYLLAKLPNKTVSMNVTKPHHQSIFTTELADIDQLTPFLKQRGFDTTRYLPIATTSQ